LKLLYDDVRANGVGGVPVAGTLYNPAQPAPAPPPKGKMFGVLICVDAQGVTQVLKAFSGTDLNGNMTAPVGWCPPVPSTDAVAAQAANQRVIDAENALPVAKAEADLALAEFNLAKAEWWAGEPNPGGPTRTQLADPIKAQMTPLRKPWNTLTPAQQATYLTDAARAPLLANLQAQLAALDPPAGSPVAVDLASKDQAVITTRTQLQSAQTELQNAQNAQQNDNATNRRLTNYSNSPNETERTRPFSTACAVGPNGRQMHLQGQTGFCAAPKLLAEAHSRGWTPVALAECWIGKPAGTREDAKLAESCDCCRSFIGFALCGLSQRQQAREAELAPAMST
jgi:hypothetical protein